ncbi:Putative coenzyme F420-dependent oxidoreductase [Candidatus Calditenuaceae archaeon HR02]|nr:Putative coenzyme F420-dependent oxidoreductase [Candidatus Calditenuaceae archaeon HR02]
MRLGVGWNISHPVSRIVELATRSEELGFESFWLHENPMLGDGFASLILTCRGTARIRLGIACTSVITRHPVMIAASAVTLHNESGGRFVLGICLGGFPWLPLIGHPVQPVKETKPLRRLVEAASVIRSLVNGEAAAVNGNFYNVQGFRLMVKASKPIPLYIGALGPRTLRMAPRIFDGVITSPGVLTPLDVRRLVGWVEEGEKNGRKVEKLAYVLSSVSGDEAEAYEAVKRDPFFIYQLSEVVPEESLQQYGVGLGKLPEIREAWRRREIAAAANLISDDMVATLTASGRKEDAINKIEEYSQTGADTLIITPVGNVETVPKTFGPIASSQ